jgi:uncharacterized protein
MSAVTAFFEDRIVASGERDAVARRIEEGYAPSDLAAIRVFENEGGRVVDLDYYDAAKAAQPARPRGRPKLGVTAREITLLPRQWDWLARQPGGASATIRRLVEAARREPASAEAAREAAYRFMSEMCGDRPGYEEALRAPYRGERARFDTLIAAWPDDVRDYLARLLEGSTSLTPAEAAS